MDLPYKLTVQPEEVARAITDATAKQKNIAYVRPVWRLIMLIIRSIPEGVFKKMSI
ncbi:hypothetical protein ACFMBG_15665 [Leisingera sp. D0M16]|uniref:hypothetical protein n=1 Tax=Leisingera coralii TaxID=3351347 RepID=UPI003B782B7A